MIPPTRIAALLFLALPVRAQVTQLVSVSSDEEQGHSYSFRPSISGDGRFVAFTSYADNFAYNDTNGEPDVFVRDRYLGTTECVSLSPSGAVAWEACDIALISGDGRFVLFETRSTNLVPGRGNGRLHVFIRDRQLGTTEVASLAWNGSLGQHDSYPDSISADGRFVTFQSTATNMVPGDTNGWADVFLRDRLLGTTECVSVDPTGVPGNGGGERAFVSADGRYVAFGSGSTNLVPGGTSGIGDAFIRDRQTGTTKLVSVSSNGAQGDANSGAAAISQDGRYVLFGGNATNLVPGDTNGFVDIFVRDTLIGTTECVSRATDGTQGNGHSADDGPPAISADGRFVTFDSRASNLVPGDTNGQPDVFAHDRLTGATTRVSVPSSGTEANQLSRGSRQSISSDGRFVAFTSWASNLVDDYTLFGYNVFVHDRDATGFESLCDPGAPGVTACPCSNAPISPGRGCDNSSATGGATLSASGTAYLSIDSLVFTTSGERPTALSLLFQGDAELASGAIAGQGVTCAGGSLRRLYVKRAYGGSISAPDIFAGDLYVTEQSAALGDPIQAGESRWYVVVYRDPIVPGGCSAASTFNATQTGRVAWSL